ncbi:MAG: GspH/FimT family protein [Pseudomonadales bacterium]|nr:GspH/FimT family protein [Pseudomonadales bacterium]
MWNPSIRRRRTARGLTLGELLAALAVVAVLAAVAAPGMAGLVANRQSDAASEQMLRAVRYTRSLAVTRRVTATLCPGAGERCGPRDSWHEGAFVFLDRDADGRRALDEPVARRMPPLPRGYRATWRSFRNRVSLSMRPTGLTDWQAGNLLICPPDGDPKGARQLIINAQGRVRQARDSDGDGIVENADGNPVSCQGRSD